MTGVKIAARRTFRSLHNPNYRKYFLGQTVSMTGTWMQSVAQMWLVLQITGSAVALGTVSALQFAPMLVLGPWGGLVADRFDKRRTLILTQGSAGALALILAAATATGLTTIPLIYSLALLWGLVIAVDNPTRQSFVAEMVDGDDLSNAVALNSAIITAARTFGPALAGVVITVAGIALCFFFNAASYAAVIAGLLRMDAGALNRSELQRRGRGQLRAGFRYAWRTPQLRSTLLLMAIVGTLAYNFRMLLPLLAERVFDGGPGTFGALSAVMGAGTVMGALAAAGRARPTRRMLLGSALAFGALILAVAVAPTLSLALVALVPMGAASIVFAATANSTLQMSSDPSKRGRVMALYAVVFLGSTPIGGPLVGWVAEAFGTRAAFALGGVATLFGAVVALRQRITREALGVMRRARHGLASPPQTPRPATTGPRGRRRGAGARLLRRNHRPRSKQARPAARTDESGP